MRGQRFLAKRAIKRSTPREKPAPIRRAAYGGGSTPPARRRSAPFLVLLLVYTGWATLHLHRYGAQRELVAGRLCPNDRAISRPPRPGAQIGRLRVRGPKPGPAVLRLKPEEPLAAAEIAVLVGKTRLPLGPISAQW